MDSGTNSEVTMPESKVSPKDKGKTVAWAEPPSKVMVSTKATPLIQKGNKFKKGVAITDFVLRLGVIGAAMGAATIMGTTEEQLPFFTQFLQFHAQWAMFPMFQFCVMANATVSGYAVLSLPFSIVCIVRPHAVAPRLLLLAFDIVMTGLVLGGASAAAAIVYLGHNGSQDANWMAFCMGFTGFCQGVSEAVVLSYVAAVFLLLLVSLSSLALKRK